MDIWLLILVGVITLLNIAAIEPGWSYYYVRFSWKLMGADMAVFAGTVVLGIWLLSLHPLMQVGWWKLFSGTGTNVYTIGWQVPFFGIAFCILLLVALPKLVKAEEEMFREGTQGWGDGLVRSTKFGLAHVLFAGIPIGIGLALILVGLFYTYLYFRGGVELSIQGHLQYNMIIVLIMLAGAVLVTFGVF